LPCRGHDTVSPCWTWPGRLPGRFFAAISRRVAKPRRQRPLSSLSNQMLFLLKA